MSRWSWEALALGAGCRGWPAVPVNSLAREVPIYKSFAVLNSLWKDWCWSWSSSTLATWCKEPTHWKRPWCWERLKVGGEGDDRGWDGWMASLHWCHGHEFEQALGVGDGQGSPVCCSPWGHKELNTTKCLNNNNSNIQVQPQWGDRSPGPGASGLCWGWQNQWGPLRSCLKEPPAPLPQRHHFRPCALPSSSAPHTRSGHLPAPRGWSPCSADQVSPFHLLHWRQTSFYPHPSLDLHP